MIQSMYMFTRRTAWLGLLLLLMGGGLLGMPRDTAAQSLLDQVADHLRTRTAAAASVPGALAVEGRPIYARQTLPRFYLRRQFAPAWVTAAGPTPQADRLMEALTAAFEEGLYPADYHLDRLRTERALIDRHRATGQPLDPRRLAEFDLLCTDAFMLYGTHLLTGHVDPETVSPDWTIERRAADFAQLLTEALAQDELRATLQRLAPPQPAYAQLKAALAGYRQLDKEGGWPTVPEGPTLQQGDTGPRVATLRRRLRITGDLPPVPQDTAAETFGAVLEDGVRRFQTRHGLDADAVVGPATLQALNVPVAARIRQLRVNLERWRWMPQRLGARHVLVNIAGFQLRLIEDGHEVLAMRVVTGRPYRQTPVFSGEIAYLVFNPYWNVPTSIAVKDKLPVLKADPASLVRQGFEVFRGWGPDAQPLSPTAIDWAGVTGSTFSYRLRQKPGPYNALGRVKFMFPNKYSVYLHDTPSRELFARTDRSFSSGCIRLERPLDLAAYLLMNQAGWSRAQIEQEVQKDTERVVSLSQKMPVHLQYWTAWAEPDGTVHFRRDIYSRDDAVARALDADPPSVSGL